MSPRKDLTLSEKKEILRKFDALPKCSQRVASKVLGIPQSSLSRILQKRDEITTEIHLNGNVERKRKRSGKGSVVENVLLDWYHTARENNEPVTRSILMKKAEELAKEYHLDNFKATDGWLTRWKTRNNIALRRYGAEVILARTSIPENISSVLANYAPNQIYNCDKTVVSIYEHTKLSEIGDVQLTVVLACNMLGDKKMPLVVGKSSYLECFKGTEMLPVQFESSEEGFITEKIFASFLLEWDKALGCENIALLLYNSCNHFENLVLKNIKMIFLPTDISLIQPLDQGLIETFKSLYEKSIQMKNIDNISNTKSSFKTVEEMSFLDVLHMIADAWQNVTSTCIYNCFIKAGINHKHDHLGFNTVKEESLESAKFDTNSDAWLASYKLADPDVYKTEQRTQIVISEQTSKNISECIDESIISEKVSENTIADSARENIDSCDNLDMEIEKYLEQSLYEGKPVTSKETCSALTVIRKTLEQRGASLLCYELFYKLENEIGKLIQKSS